MQAKAKNNSLPPLPRGTIEQERLLAALTFQANYRERPELDIPWPPNQVRVAVAGENATLGLTPINRPPGF